MSSPAALSPSRANDFRKCPLQFRLLVVDRIPTPPAPARERGTLVHAVLEDLFDRPAAERTREAARAEVDPTWERLCANDPSLEESLFGPDLTREAFLEGARDLVGSYFHIENPTRLEPAHREVYLRTQVADGLNIHGFVDRVDVSATGQVRVVDYKTGKAPQLAYLAPYLFQLRFYALAWRQIHGHTPTRLQLLFLKSEKTYTHDPTDAELDATEEELADLWTQIERAAETGNFAPRRTPLCGWCEMRQYCPLFGGTTPPLPAEGIARLLTMHA